MAYKDKDKQREYGRKWIAARRAKWILENGPCVDCGSWDDLEVDHVDPATKDPKLRKQGKTRTSTSNLWSWSDERRTVELAKCVVRCHSCHKVKTAKDVESKVHGTAGMYRKQCRCEICKKYQRDRQREYRKALRC